MHARGTSLTTWTSVIAGWIALGGLACSYIMPATWRSFRVDPDDAAPAITRALAVRNMGVAAWDTTNHAIVSDYLYTTDGLDRRRERYVVRWERNADDGSLVIFVRHEVQDEGSTAAGQTWEATSHDADKEIALLEAITAELQRMRQPAPAASVPGSPR